MNLEGARVLLTGATGGIGRCLAEALAGEGATLTVTGRQADRLHTIAGRSGARAIVADLSEASGAVELADRAGPVDVLIANAAIPASGAVLDYDPGDIDRAIDVNLRAPIHLARALAPGMVERGHGHLVFVSSLAGVTASPSASLYNATKFGLRGFANGLRQDLAGTGVGVSVILPGFVRDAGMFADSGAVLPWWVGTSSPEGVARSTVRAVAHNRAEVAVAPPAMVVGAYLGGALPGAAARVQRLFGGTRIARSVAAGQRRHR